MPTALHLGGRKPEFCLGPVGIPRLLNIFSTNLGVSPVSYIWSNKAAFSSNYFKRKKEERMGSETWEEHCCHFSVGDLPSDQPASAEEAQSEWSTSVQLVPNRHIANNGHPLPSDGTSWMTYLVSAFFVSPLPNPESRISPSSCRQKPLTPFCSLLVLLLSEVTITGMTSQAKKATSQLKAYPFT